MLIVHVRAVVTSSKRRFMKRRGSISCLLILLGSLLFLNCAFEDYVAKCYIGTLVSRELRLSLLGFVYVLSSSNPNSITKGLATRKVLFNIYILVLETLTGYA